MIDVNPTLPFDERWFSTALRSLGDAVVATDEQGNVLFLNPVAESLTGWSAREALGRPLIEVFRIINETTRQPVENPVEKVLSTGRVVGLANHTVLVHRDGHETPIDDSAAPILDQPDRILGVILVFRDISERRQAELNQERLAAIVESSDDIIASKDLNGVIKSWNQGAERILGYSADEVIGNHVSMLMPPEQVEDMPRILDKIRKGERVDHYHTKRRHKDGRIIDVSLTVSPIRDSEGRIIGASKIGRDITFEKQLEIERREAERRKDEFLAMLAHELRNPLASISNATLLFDGMETEEELLWAREVILRQVKHLSRLIDDLLDVSRITKGKIRLQTEPLALSPIVSSAIEAVRPLIEERKHELNVSIAPGASRLMADPLRLEQILVNLLNNAAKYTDAGGQIWLSATREGDEVVIKVRDTGLGLSPEFLPHVFDLFVQGDRSAARTEGGLGIGLTLVKKLTEMHGGSASVTSEGPDRGSEFTVRLPAMKNPPEPRVNANVSLPRTARGPSRILVVDDMPDTVRTLAKLLKLLGHDVAIAHDGQSALEVARAHRPEIVLLDIGLPGMDGYEVARRLRQEDCCRDAVLIATSGYGQEEDRRKSKEAGFDHHLVKPLDYKALTSLLSKPAPSE